MPDSKRILSEFRKAINSYTKTQVVDLDINFAEKFEFHALRLEDVFRVNNAVPPNRWSFHRIGLITQGSGEFRTSLYKIPARKNTLVIVPARVMTSSRNWSPDVKGLIVLFNRKFLLRQDFSYKFLQNKKILAPYIKPYIHLSDDAALHIENMFEKILKEQAEHKDHWQELMSLKAIELIIECERLFSENGNLNNDMPSHNVVSAFGELLERHFHEQRSVAFYASKLNMHPNYLNSLLKKQTGDTAKETINHRLLIEIKYLLHTTTLSIKEIASRVGFENPNYLTAFFTRIEKISPLAYRTAVA